MSTVYLGLGSNLGDREANLVKALGLLTQQVTIGQVSSIYETEPVGYLEQPWFLNLVCVGETKMDPFGLLAFAKEIESELGRVSSFPNAPRPIDIDLLLYNDQKIDTEDLTIPHPRMAQRRFVLAPMVEIAASVIHPVDRKTMKELLTERDDSTQVRKWGNV
ncbi:MAG: 2-amino-4-hydroxy-6-hydroxymethyldihydropteridine diphosphokinase [Chloroflexi bacterium]|nr:2-amino-4-hydroxy-6-hydroxymethyldihydropteridine diphosphokinase [Chloroflexota bacterium]